MTVLGGDIRNELVVPLHQEAGRLRVSELYDKVTVQGEGPHVGRFCTFVRLYGCNLACMWCDTSFTWDVSGRNGIAYPRDENSTTMDIAHVAAHVVGLAVPILVVTGGEPLLQSRAVSELAHLLEVEGIETHVETNGTRPPLPVYDAVAHYSVSPKLPSALAGKNALLLDTLALWAGHPRAIFKVVCCTAADVVRAGGLFDLLDVAPAARWIMPEGITPAATDRSAKLLIDAVLALGLNMTPRLHVQLWGTERGR